MKISIPKQVAVLQRNLVKVFDYQVNTLTLDDDGSIYVVIEPSDGYWKGGRFQFKIGFPDDFPDKPPQVWNIDSGLLHPNIAREGPVCLNILNQDWRSSYGLDDIIQGLLFLFHHPDFDEPNSDSIYYYKGCGKSFEAYVSEIIGRSIGFQRDTRLYNLNYKNQYIVNLAKSMLDEVVNRQLEYNEADLNIEPIKRETIK